MHEETYPAIREAWQHLASWREKIFAGYLAVLAGLAIGFSQTPSLPLRATVLVAGILVSLVFWILDVRNTQLLNAVQAAAAKFEGPGGAAAALSGVRFREERSYFTYGLAIDLLVGAVVAASGGGLALCVIRLYQTQPRMLWLGLAPVVGLLITWGFQEQRSQRWRLDRDEQKKNGQTDEGNRVPPRE